MAHIADVIVDYRNCIVLRIGNNLGPNVNDVTCTDVADLIARLTWAQAVVAERDAMADPTHPTEENTMPRYIITARQLSSFSVRAESITDAVAKHERGQSEHMDDADQDLDIVSVMIDEDNG